jgi:hypothetical protein
MNELLVREAWISACHFHDLSEADVLREVSARVSAVRAKGERHPLVLLDLDSTLYEVGTRTLAIFQEWAATPAAEAHARVRGAVRALRPEQVGYSVRDTLRALGLDPDAPDSLAATAAIKEFWAARFFTSAYLPHDRPYPGAARFAREVHELGAEIVYLTGRDETGMGDGTRANLKRDGFPWEVDRTHLLLKPNFEDADLEHKRKAADYIRKHGTLVASFENEPPNLVALHDIFPEAMHVFVQTVCSDHGARACEGLYRIRGFAD